MGHHYITGIHLSAEGLTIQKCLMFHVLGNIGRRTCLRESTALDNTASNKSINRPDQSVELKLLGAHGYKYHPTTSLIHAANITGIGVHG